MTDNTVDGLSIDEILSSIKKYVSSGDSTDIEEKKDDSKENRNDIPTIRLQPSIEEEYFEEEKKENYDQIQMPRFIQKISEKNKIEEPKNIEIKNIEIADHQINEKKDTFVENEIEQNKSTDVLKNFVNDVNKLINKSKSEHQNIGFDSFVKSEIKKAIFDWINANMHPIVEEIVKKEIRRITEKLEL